MTAIWKCLCPWVLFGRHPFVTSIHNFNAQLSTPAWLWHNFSSQRLALNFLVTIPWWPMSQQNLLHHPPSPPSGEQHKLSRARWWTPTMLTMEVDSKQVVLKRSSLAILEAVDFSLSQLTLLPAGNWGTFPNDPLEIGHFVFERSKTTIETADPNGLVSRTLFLDEVYVQMIGGSGVMIDPKCRKKHHPPCESDHGVFDMSWFGSYIPIFSPCSWCSIRYLSTTRTATQATRRSSAPGRPAETNRQLVGKARPGFGESPRRFVHLLNMEIWKIIYKLGISWVVLVGTASCEINNLYLREGKSSMIKWIIFNILLFTKSVENVQLFLKERSKKRLKRPFCLGFALPPAASLVKEFLTCTWPIWKIIVNFNTFILERMENNKWLIPRITTSIYMIKSQKRIENQSGLIIWQITTSKPPMHEIIAARPCALSTTCSRFPVSTWCVSSLGKQKV